MVKKRVFITTNSCDFFVYEYSSLTPKNIVSVFEKIWNSVCRKETCNSLFSVNLKELSLKFYKL